HLRITIRHSLFHDSRLHPYLHSFPTRRSSDLLGTKPLGQHLSGDRLHRGKRLARAVAGGGLAVELGGGIKIVVGHVDRPQGVSRSEEHTSELQSRFDLVCRLLLEKKNSNLKDC